MEGLCDLTDDRIRERYYRNLPVSEIWGVGRRLVPRLNDVGIRTIEQFVNADPTQIRQIMTITGVRLQAELRGECCLQLSEMAEIRKGFACTRSFGRPITSFGEMREAIAGFAVRATEKLRAEKLDAGYVSVFIQTNPHKRSEGWYANQASITCAPTQDALTMINIVTRLLRKIWREGYRYTKGGVQLNDLAPSGRQSSLFGRPKEQTSALMEAMDAINSRYGRETVRPLATRTVRSWRPRQDMLSPRYTTEIGEIMEVMSF